MKLMDKYKIEQLREEIAKAEKKINNLRWANVAVPVNLLKKIENAKKLLAKSASMNLPAEKSKSDFQQEVIVYIRKIINDWKRTGINESNKADRKIELDVIHRKLSCLSLSKEHKKIPDKLEKDLNAFSCEVAKWNNPKMVEKSNNDFAQREIDKIQATVDGWKLNATDESNVVQRQMDMEDKHKRLYNLSQEYKLTDIDDLLSDFEEESEVLFGSWVPKNVTLSEHERQQEVLKSIKHRINSAIPPKSEKGALLLFVDNRKTTSQTDQRKDRRILIVAKKAPVIIESIIVPEGQFIESSSIMPVTVDSENGVYLDFHKTNDSDMVISIWAFIRYKDKQGNHYIAELKSEDDLYTITNARTI